MKSSNKESSEQEVSSALLRRQRRGRRDFIQNEEMSIESESNDIVENDSLNHEGRVRLNSALVANNDHVEKRGILIIEIVDSGIGLTAEGISKLF